MSEFFIPIPPWLRNGEIKENHEEYIFKCRNCGLNFVAYSQSDQCPVCNSDNVMKKKAINDMVNIRYNSEQKK